MARETMNDVILRGKLPILVGGSGLYFAAILDGFFSINLKKEDRAAFAETVQDAETEALYERLCSVDPASAGRIHHHDRYRIVRALEVHALTGIPMSEHFKRQKASTRKPELRILKVGLDMPRSELYRNINERTVKMIESGWVEEVQRLLREGAEPGWPGFQTLGYPQVISHIRGDISRAACIETISRLTRRYAKRQLTWFRREKDVRWCRADDPKTMEAVITLMRTAGESAQAE
jgi:tRNA dimethylallyltransferase